MSDTSEQCGVTKNDGEPCTHPGKYDDGKCGYHTEEKESGPGRPSKIDDHRDDVLQAARNGLTIENCANAAGVGESTLYDWLNEHEDFSESFKRARMSGAQTLIQRGLHEDNGYDSQFARFLLERSHGYTKTEDKNIDMSGSLTVDTEFVAIDE